LTPYELIDLALGATNRIDVQWGLFISVHLALFGGIIYVERPLRMVEKAAALFVYLLFAVFNYRVMYTQMTFLGSLYADVAAFASEACCSSLRAIAHVVSEVEGGRFERNRLFLGVAHLAMGILAVLSIVFDRALSPGARSDTA
jgi:hypothetical protein